MKYIPSRIVSCHITLLLALALIVLLAPASALEAHSPAQVEGLQDEGPVTVDYRFYERGVIEIKFREGLHIRLRNGVPTDLSGQALENAEAAAVLDAVAGGSWARTHRLDEATLEEMRAEAMAREGQALPDLNLWFRLELPPGMEAAVAIEQFRQLKEVEGAFPVPKPAPPPLPPDYSTTNNDNFDNTPSLNRNVYQRYLDAAPVGLDFRYAWQGDGGAGEGIAICDIEYGWNEDHADLPEVTLLGDEPDSGNPSSWWEHGTAVLGQLAALDNGWGVTGMAHEAKIYFAASDTASGGYNLASAITTCADELEAGDIILLEQQIAGPNASGSGQQGLVPVEWNKAAYDAIKTAVGNGIVVVEAAGNGSENLDDDDYSTGNGGHHPFEPGNDSGAIIVGSANSPYMASPRSRLSSSNYGSTVDLQGWGRDIVTTGYGQYYNTEGQDLWYTHAFGGTSGASPMVTSAVAVVQSTYLVKNGSPATPSAVKNLLRNTGTPQAGTDNIGPQPNLKAAIERIWNFTAPAAPAISPASGTYNMPINVTIDYGSSAQNWNNTSIRYTLDGSEPGEDDYIYIPEQDSGVYLLYGVTLKAKAFQYHAPAGRLFESATVERSYASSTPKVATPVISPGAGYYNQPHQVTITTSTSGAEIRYRTDGRSISFFYPGTLYTGPITLPPGNYEITARAYKDGYYKSDVAESGEIVVNPTTLPPPTIYPNGGEFAGETFVFLQSTVIGADIRYTLDGSTPSSASPVYETAIPLTESTTVKARTYLAGYSPSSVTTATFDIVEQAAAPIITPNGGVYNGSVQVTLSTSTPGATIRYTDNGAEPTSYSPLYEEPIVLGAGQHTVRARAFLEGSQPSGTSSASFTVYESPDGTVENPTMDPFYTRYFVEPFTVTMHTDTQGATIYYTMASDTLPPDPTTSSTMYTGPFTVNANGNWFFKMRAFKSGSTPSGVVQSGQLSLGPPSGTTNVPTITPNGGTFTNSVQVTLSSPDNFEIFYYTTDGSGPVSGPPVILPSRQYNAPFNVSQPTTVRAQAYRPFFASGGIASAEFTFVCDTPTITPSGGTFSEEVEIQMSTDTSNAKIYYTLDGSEPDESDTEYTGPFTLEEGSYPIKARCFRTNFDPSATALSVVLVQPEPVAPTFTLQPVSQTVDEGAAVTFTAEATGMPEPMYQWQRDGINLAGQTEPELTIPAARPGDAGRYRLLAWNSAGELFSQEAVLTVNPSDPGGPIGDYKMYMPLLIR